jgi:antitoxin (DNA-binding transcriptional repressor) of toxin-antitoxin stability system
MRTIALEELETGLAEYVRLAAEGETIRVTERDRVVAELGPPRERREPATEEEILADLARRGLVTPASLPRGTLPQRHRLVKVADLLAGLDADRAER